MRLAGSCAGKPMLTRIQDVAFRWLWERDLGEMDPHQASVFRGLRAGYLILRELAAGELSLRAMGLVYTTLLSLVPLLAVSFSVLKAFGVHNQIQPLLLNFTAPLGPKGAELVNQVLSFVENVRVGVLGSMGLALLLYTVVSLIQKIESSFNSIWQVTRARSFARRFSDYLSVLLVGPVLVFSAIGITASITSHALVQKLIAIEPFGTAMLVAGKVMPYLFIIGAFTFIYMFVPNTRVQLRSALVGGLVGGVAWQTTGLVFASFAAGSTRYDAIYSSFAILVLFMIWLYLSWLILLVGTRIAFFHQHPDQIRLQGGPYRISNRLKERAGLLVMYLITADYYRGGRPWDLDRLVAESGLASDLANDVITLLERQRFLVETADEPPAYYPARAPESVTLAELLDSLRTAEDGGVTGADLAGVPQPVNQVMLEMESGIRGALHGMSLKDMVVRSESR
jgi:membrane protein